jgi:tetratricopeptide (TPR) repeat protein
VSSFFKHLGTAAVLLVLVLGAAAMGYARWTRDIAEGDAALAAGDFERAAASYVKAEGRFASMPSTRRLFAADYHHAAANHLYALYHLGRLDELIEQAEKSPEEASPHYWAGIAYFIKAQLEEENDSALAWLTRAEEELRKAVAAAPEDWDTKYDYELATRLAEALRKEPKAPPKQMMQLLRPPTGAKPVRRVP